MIQQNLSSRLASFIISIYYLNNKARYSYIYVAYSQPNGWTEWAEIIFFHIFFSTGNAAPGPSASLSLFFVGVKIWLSIERANVLK